MWSGKFFSSKETCRWCFNHVTNPWINLDKNVSLDVKIQTEAWERWWDRRSTTVMHQRGLEGRGFESRLRWRSPTILFYSTIIVSWFFHLCDFLDNWLRVHRFFFKRERCNVYSRNIRLTRVVPNQLTLVVISLTYWELRNNTGLLGLAWSLSYWRLLGGNSGW